MVYARRKKQTTFSGQIIVGSIRVKYFSPYNSIIFTTAVCSDCQSFRSVMHIIMTKSVRLLLIIQLFNRRCGLLGALIDPFGGIMSGTVV